MTPFPRPHLLVVLAAALCLWPALQAGAQQAPSGWGELAPLLVPRSEMAVAELGGKIYVIAGLTPERVISDVVQVYDSRTNTWAYGTPLPMPMHHTAAVPVDGLLYVVGGETGAGAPVFLDTVYVYDPATETWSARAPMPTGRSASGVAVIDGKIYVAGGRPPHGHDFAVYDPRTDAWTALPDLPTQRNHVTAGAIGGKLYIAGGRFGPGNNSELTDVLEIYDPAANTWTSGPSMPEVRSGMAAAVVNDCLYAIGGEWDRSAPSGVFPQNEAFDPGSGVWHVLEPMVRPVHGLTGTGVLNDKIYIPGGALTNGLTLAVSTALQTFQTSLSCRPA